ncbi:MAG: prepilin-type N-terminal cleavage/methylation domain-containing protein [Candidatus Gracilibacteria bacterium]
MKKKNTKFSNFLDIKHYKLIYNKGFTLIELIIVVTIIAILSTIGYISYRSYLLNSRDSIRKSELSDIYTLLDSYKIKAQLSVPDNKIDLYSSGFLIGFQGNLSKDILLKIGFKGTGKDPLDQVYYTYFLTKDLRNPGVMGFLENNSVTGNFGVISKTYAVDYSERYPIIFGKKLGILVDENNTPIQAIPEIQASGSLELSTLTSDYTAFFDNSTSISNSLYSMDILYGTTTVGIIGNSCEQYIEEYDGEILRSGYYLINTSTGTTEIYCDMSNSVTKIATCSGTMLANTYPTNGNTYIQTFDGTNWNPDSISWSYSGTICGFNCLDTHTWSGALNECLQKINGVCGSATLLNITTEPISGLCAGGDPSTISGIWPSTWTCNGRNGGTDDNCSTTRYCMGGGMTPCISH